VSKKHYNDNKEYYKERNQRQEKESLDFYEQYKEQLCCCFCKENEPCCLDFHHVNPNEKEYGVAQMARRYSVDAIKREIAKCIVVCANCHRKVHAGKISPLSVVEAYQSSKLLGWDRNPEGILQE
jgi:hypothetical protein